MNFGEWIKEHPILAGTGVLAAIILFIIIRGRSSSAPVVTGSQNSGLELANLQAQLEQQGITAAQQEQTNQLNAALEVAQLQAGTQNQQTTAAQQVAAQQLQAQLDAAGLTLQAQGAGTAAQVQLAQIAADAGNTQAQTQASAAEEIAGAQANTAIATTTAQVGGAVSIAGIQAGVQNNQIQAALDAQKNIDAATITINGENTQADITKALDQLTATQDTNSTQATIAQAEIAAALKAALDSNNTQLLTNQNNNATKVAVDNIIANNNAQLAQISAGTQAAAITAEQDVYTTFLNNDAAVALGQANEQAQSQALQDQNVQNLIAYLESGNTGLSQTNRATLFATLFGAPQVGQTISSTSNAASTAPGPFGQFLAGLGIGIGKAAPAFV